jgi:AmiR/NasT family two-component response regulator
MEIRGAHDEVDRLRSEVDNLQAALTTRDVIGQAKGVLMERHGIGADEAFERLVRLSQDTNTKLHDVAARIAGAGRDGDAGGDEDPREAQRPSESVG